MTFYAWIAVSCCLFIIKGTTSRCYFKLENLLAGKTPIALINDAIINQPINRTGDLLVANGQRIQFLCSGADNYLVNRQIGPLANATCLKRQYLLEPNRTAYRVTKRNVANLQCSMPPQPQAREIGICNIQSKKIQLGFQINPSKFLPLVELCYDANRLTTYWTRHQLVTSGCSCNTSDTTSFKKDFFNNVTVGAIYAQNSQFTTGHLTPHCDFFNGPTKRMTYYYVNAAPQISEFNQGNWRHLEQVIRTLLIYSRWRESLYVYTGTTHTVQYLNNSIPVPLYFWKVVIEGTKGNGVAFVGINDIQKDVPSPCEEMRCDLLVFAWWRIEKGIIYCCTIQSLRNIPNIQLPEFSEFKGGLLELESFEYQE